MSRVPPARSMRVGAVASTMRAVTGAASRGGKRRSWGAVTIGTHESSHGLPPLWPAGSHGGGLSALRRHRGQGARTARAHRRPARPPRHGGVGGRTRRRGPAPRALVLVVAGALVLLAAGGGASGLAALASAAARRIVRPTSRRPPCPCARRRRAGAPIDGPPPILAIATPPPIPELRADVPDADRTRAETLVRRLATSRAAERRRRAGGRGAALARIPEERVLRDLLEAVLLAAAQQQHETPAVRAGHRLPPARPPGAADVHAPAAPPRCRCPWTTGDWTGGGGRGAGRHRPRRAQLRGAGRGWATRSCARTATARRRRRSAPPSRSATTRNLAPAAGAHREGAVGRAGDDRAAALALPRPLRRRGARGGRAARSCAPWSATTPPSPAPWTTSRPNTIPVILFTREGYYDASGAPAWSGGVYDGIDGRIRIPIGGLTASLTPDMDETLIHELTHAFVADRTRGVAPREVCTRASPSTWRASARVDADQRAAHRPSPTAASAAWPASTWPRSPSWST